ncbi:MAG: hypothetical protein NTY19_22290 [Planctomycetota bacterium]|nr:hypothetical protein [Planctomycetota bacterium]
MNRRNVSIHVVQDILSLVLVACPLGAAEFRPVAVWTDAECYSNPSGKYAAEKMIDGDLGTSQAGLHAVVRHDYHLGQSRQEPVDDVVEAPQPHWAAPAVPHGGLPEQDHGLLRARPLRRTGQ